jgi:hypothetical protein
MKIFNFIKNKPIASFYYAGTHKRSIKRLVLIKEITDEKILGYELSNNCSKLIENLEKAPVKCFLKNKMEKDKNKKILLERFSVYDFINNNIK